MEMRNLQLRTLRAHSFQLTGRKKQRMITKLAGVDTVSSGCDRMVRAWLSGSLVSNGYDWMVRVWTLWLVSIGHDWMGRVWTPRL